MTAETEVSGQESEVRSQVNVRADGIAGPIRDLAQKQLEYGLPDAEFASQLSLGYSGSSWGKMKAGNFPGNQEKALRAVRRALAALAGGLAPSKGKFVLFEHVQGVFDALEVARENERPNRLVILVEAMGMGKSTMAKQLVQRAGATLLEGRPTWSNSYNATLTDFAEALGLSVPVPSSARLEKAIVDDLKASPRLFAVDEANFFTGDGLNFVKYVLNSTDCVMVLLTLPEDYARWTAANRHESRQLVRRSVAIFRAPPVAARDVTSVQAAGWPDLYLNGSAPKIASAANRFGGLDFVVRVLEEIDPDAGEEDAEAAISRVCDTLEQKR
ncbi:MAG: AAA family ATPase [Kiritimatiellae bacterium]|jgi:hypothetical protein|nr:AAA family ATPase [Kiritimatiellia bacterium]